METEDAQRPVAQAKSPPPPEHVARVLSARLQRTIERRLARAGFSEEDCRDLQQEVTTDLLYMDNPPTDEDGCGKAANDITTKTIAGHHRSQYRSRKRIAGPTDEADNHVQDDRHDLATGHRALQIATLHEAKTEGELTDSDARMFAMKFSGMSDAEIGADAGIAAQSVANRLVEVRKVVRTRWQTRMAQLAALGFAVLLAVFAWRKRDEIADLFRTPTPHLPSPAPTRPKPEPSIPVATQAHELRKQAGHACLQEKYAECSDLLDAASKLDPAGDMEPNVRRLHHYLEDSIRHDRSFDAKEYR